jgi:hypothetical protein
LRAGAGLPTVLERIGEACRRARRDPGDVRLVAVSKSFPAGRVRALMEQGQRLFGENRVQEAKAKMAEVGPGATWHLVGTLQRNKARRAVGLFELIHSVDDLELAREIDRRAAAASLRQPILLQVNLSGEATKSGVGEAGFGALLDGIVALPHVEPLGLMTIPPPAASADASRRWFAGLREMRERASRRAGLPLAELSMGMSDDFEVAIEEGATLVRIGRALFGERPLGGVAPLVE